MQVCGLVAEGMKKKKEVRVYLSELSQIFGRVAQISGITHS